MAHVVENCKKPCLQVRWIVAVPRVGQSSESSWISVMGYYWMLKLRTEWDENSTDEIWTMNLLKYDTQTLIPKLLLTAYVRDKAKDRFMAHKEITNVDVTEIWRYTQRSFLRSYPKIKTTGKPITFTFTFESGDLDFIDGQSIGTVFKDEIYFKLVVFSWGAAMMLQRCRETWYISKWYPKKKEHKSVQTSPYLDCLENLSRDFRKLMDDDGSYRDVHLRCGNCTITAHKLILGARSEVFRAMLQSDMVEGSEGSVEIVDMEPNVFEIFIRYLYTGILPDLTEEIALPLYEAGDKYNLKALTERCGDFLAENLTSENACEILCMADAHSDKDLKERVVSYILEEKIPGNGEEWTKFYDDHPKLAIEVYSRNYT